MARKRNKHRSLGIFADLVRAINWYDISLQSLLESQGLTTVNRTQSIILAHIAGGITRPSDIAHDTGATRQNIHSMAKPLIDARIIEVVPDPEDRRAIQYALCEDSLELRDKAVELLRYLDRQLGERIGKDELKALKHALSQDWGEEISQLD